MAPGGSFVVGSARGAASSGRKRPGGVGPRGNGGSSGNEPPHREAAQWPAKRRADRPHAEVIEGGKQHRPNTSHGGRVRTSSGGNRPGGGRSRATDPVRQVLPLLSTSTTRPARLAAEARRTGRFRRCPARPIGCADRATHRPTVRDRLARSRQNESRTTRVPAHFPGDGVAREENTDAATRTWQHGRGNTGVVDRCQRSPRGGRWIIAVWCFPLRRLVPRQRGGRSSRGGDEAREGNCEWAAGVAMAHRSTAYPVRRYGGKRPKPYKIFRSTFVPLVAGFPGFSPLPALMRVGCSRPRQRRGSPRPRGRRVAGRRAAAFPAAASWAFASAGSLPSVAGSPPSEVSHD